MSGHMITTLEPAEDEDLRYPVPFNRQPVLYRPPPLPEINLIYDEVKKSIAPPEATEAEILAFIKIAEHLGLDPWRREIMNVEKLIG